MANAHITAALRCSKFKGTTRLVLLVFSDAASPGQKKEENGKKKGLPLGYCKRRLSTIMALVNSTRQQTVSSSISELMSAGAIKKHQRTKGGQWQVPLFFVDLDWLKANAYTDEELEQFGYESLREKREEEKQAEANHNANDPNNLDADDLFPDEMVFMDKTPVSRPSVAGKDSPEPLESIDDEFPTADLPAPYPLATSVSPTEQRKAANGDNGNRLTVPTESVVSHNGNRLTDFPPCPTPALRLGDFDPPSDDGFVPPASQDTSRSRHSLRSDEQHQDQPQEQHQPPVPAGANGNAHPEVPLPVDSAHLGEIPRPRSHYWPGKDRTDDTPCKWCGSLYGDRYLREPCLQTEAANA